MNKVKYFSVAAGAVLVLLLSIAMGSANINVLDIAAVVAHKLFGAALPERIAASDVTIIWSIRLPRTLLAFFVGGMLSASGAVIQSVLRNPLASPYTLGVSAGASLGAGLVIIFSISLPFLQGFTLPFVGLLFSIVTILAVVTFSSKVDRSMSNYTIVLTGMVLSLFFSALLTLITSFAQNDLKRIVLWQMGSFSMKSWPQLWLSLPLFVLGFGGVLFYLREMDLLVFGEEQAAAMGVNVPRVKRNLLICAAIMTGTAVSVSGIIGFIDLIAPHVVRRCFGSKHRVVLPLSVLFGGCLMVLADLLSRTVIAPAELPVGAVTALLGTPFFIFIYFSKRKQ